MHTHAHAHTHTHSCYSLLRKHGADYERHKFQQQLLSGRIRVEKTKAWLHGTLLDPAAAAALADARSAILATRPGDASPETRAAVHRVVTAGLLRLVTGDESAAARDVCPETLRLDAPRLHMIQNDVQRVVLASALVAAAKELAGARGAAVSAAAAEAATERVYALLCGPQVELRQVQWVVSAEVQAWVEASGGTWKESDRAGASRAVSAIVDKSSPVYKLLKGRVAAVLRKALDGKVGDAMEHARRNGVGVCARRLANIGVWLRLVAGHSVGVFGVLYHGLLSAAARSAAK